MKIFDCTTYYDEELMMDLRFHTLNEQVEKFIVVESNFSHSGKEKKLNFDINKYSKYKDKINYIVIDNQPKELKFVDNNKITPIIKRYNSLKRIEQSYEAMMNGVKDAIESDFIILSDNDEIPNLRSNQFEKSKKEVVIFKQFFFYYKFNLLYDLMPWYGSKGCKKNKLLNMSWLRNLKNKQYPIWRIDAWFSDTKQTNIDIIEDGGWHFTNLKTPEKLFEKFQNFGHHDEFDESGINIEFIKSKMEKHEVFYDHFLDKSKKNKWNSSYKLKRIEIESLPKYIIDNKDSLKNWLA